MKNTLIPNNEQDINFKIFGNFHRVLKALIIWDKCAFYWDSIHMLSLLHKTKRHHSVKTERRHSVTFQSPFSRLNGRYISVTIQWPFRAIQAPFRRLSVIFNFLFSVYTCNWSYITLFLRIFDARSLAIMSECNTHI